MKRFLFPRHAAARALSLQNFRAVANRMTIVYNNFSLKNGAMPLSSRGNPGSYAASHCFRTHMSIIFKFPDVRELTAHIGQTVFVLDEERGWALVNTFYHEEGWSPLRNLAFHAETD